MLWEAKRTHTFSRKIVRIAWDSLDNLLSLALGAKIVKMTCVADLLANLISTKMKRKSSQVYVLTQHNTEMKGFK